MARQKHLGLEARAARERGDVDRLLDLLSSTDRIARLAAAQDLGALRSARAVKPLVRCLQANDELLQVSALKALAKIGDNSSIPDVYLAAIEGASAGVRATAAETLAALGDRRAVRIVAAMLNEPNNPYPRSHRKWAGKLLVELRGTEALSELRTSLSQASFSRRWEIRRVVRQLEELEHPQRQ